MLSLRPRTCRYFCEMQAPLKFKNHFLWLCAAALNVAVLYAGIICLEALGNVLAALRLYLALAICALFGAIAYGFLIRFFWWPEFRPRSIAQTAFACMAAAVIGMGIQNLTQ